MLKKLEDQETKSGGKNKSNSSFVTTQHDTHQIGGYSKTMVQMEEIQENQEEFNTLGIGGVSFDQ